jgi:predicted ATPase
MLNRRLQTHVRQLGGARRFLYLGQKVTDHIEIDLYFAQNSYSARFEPTVDGNLFFAKETFSYANPQYKEPFQRSLGSGHQETRLREESLRFTDKFTIADYVISSIQSWKIYHFHDTSDTARIKDLGDINDNLILRPDASNLAAFLYFLQKRHVASYDLIVKVVRSTAPFFEDFQLRPDPYDPSQIRLEWRERDSEAYFNASYLSDGTLRFMCLATLLLQPTLPSTIIIDEPELGLHPHAIALLAGLLESASTQTQVIVATQSIPLVNQFAPEHLIVVDRLDRQSVFRRLEASETEHWINDYGMGDIWEKNLIGGRP